MARRTRMVAAYCPRCGAVDIPGDRVTVVEPQPENENGRWGFHCQLCHKDVWHTAPVEARRNLRAKGAVIVPASEDPARLRPGFTELDVDEFRRELERMDTAWILARCQPRGGAR